MSYFRKAFCGIALVLGMAGMLTLLACTPAGKIGQVSKFDIAKASPEDIAKALDKDGKVIVSGGILFETNSASLDSNANDLVRRIADAMKKHPNLKISVVGYTDSTGDYNYNVHLSERRAKALVEALIKDGIAANRLTAVGIGPQNPIASNDTAEGRAQNRRVELVVMH